ncbi:hypothetical protein, partial [Kribbella sp.]|uniref:hypothetical protein n=1 Tax=Kribbella sp. TaxID=1871183 RepID=UPI002D330F24
TQDIPPNANKIADNTFTGNTVDVGWTFPTATKGHANCLSGATVRTVPAGLSTKAPCPPAGASPSASGVSPSGAWTGPTPPPGIPFSEVVAPPAQPQFPNATTTGATSVPAVPALPDLTHLPIPAPTLLADRALTRAG